MKLPLSLHLSLASLLFFAVLVAGPSVSAADQTPPGLSIQNGKLMKDGQPFAAIGANYDTLFGRLLQNKDDRSSLDNLKKLAAKGIPFVRFRACGFYPQNCRLYLDDREEYFRRLDLVVRCAEEQHIGLIPSLFWHLVTFTELVGESPDRLGDPRSKVNEFIARYTSEMVSRYKDSPAIWGWEFGNEANLGVDMQPARTQRRRSPGFERGPGEALPPGEVRLTTEQLRVAYTGFAQTVRRLDPTRVIDSGTTIPRPAAWHNARGLPRQRDSAEQSYNMLLRQNPDPINLLSVHIYTRSQKLSPYGSETVGQFISRHAQAALRAGKPLFIGEFGASTQIQFKEYLDAIQENNVPLSAFWVFDNPSKPMSVSFDNERAFVLDMVVDANRKLQRPGR